MLYNKILDGLLWVFTTVLLSSFYMQRLFSSPEFYYIVFAGILAGLCLLRYGTHLNLSITPFHICIFSFAFFCCISSYWAVLPTLALHRGILIIQAALCMCVVWVYADHQNTTRPLLDSICWAGYLLTFYLLYVYGFDQLQYLMEHSIRVDSKTINANVIGMVSAFSIIVTLHRFLFVKFSIWYLLALPEIALVAVSGSRKAFVLLVLGCAAVMGTKYLKRNMLSNIFNSLIVIAALCGITYLLLSLPMFEVLKNRLDTLLGLVSSQHMADGSALIRKRMIEIGWEQFLQTPFLGLGATASYYLTAHAMGYSAYFHNNYVELLSGVGLIGTVLYYLMFLWPGIQLFKQRYYPNKNTLLCLILIILCLLLDWGRVSYDNNGTYFYILLFFMQVRLNNRQEQEQLNEQISKNN